MNRHMSATPVIIHPSSVQPLRDAAFTRLRAWVAECKAQKRFDPYIVPYENDQRGKVPYYKRGFYYRVEVAPEGLNLMSETSVYNVSLKDPTHVQVRTSSVGEKTSSQEAKAIRDEMLEVLSPVASSTGWWFADENMYPIRPMWDGEEDAEELGKRPDPTWVLIDPTTHELVNEAKETGEHHADVNVIDDRSRGGLIVMALDRIRGWCDTQKDENGHALAWVNGGISEGDSIEVHVHDAADFSRYTALVVDLKGDKVLEPTINMGVVRQRTEKPEWGPAVRETVAELARPHANVRGRWWADENYYPLRPVFQGETYKPVASWTMIDGVSGEVISEAAGDDSDTTPTYINPKNFWTMREAAENRITDWCLVHDLSGMLFVGDVAANLITIDRGNSTLLYVQYVNGDLREPRVRLGHNAYDVFNDQELAWAETHLQELQELAEPHPRSDGAWWVDDEELQLKRPVYEGEKAEFPPFEGWSIVDPTTYEPINEACSWSDDRWVARTLEAVHDEVLEHMSAGDDVGVYGPRLRVRQRLQDEAFELLFSMGLSGNDAEAVSRDWIRLLLSEIVNSSGSLHKSIFNEFRELLNRVSYAPQAKVKVVKRKTKDGKFEWEQVACTVVDLAGHIGQTIEDEPDAVWAYDPETLELLEIPTYDDARHNRGELIARLRDIDAGNV